MIIAALFSTSCTSAKQKQQTTNKQEAKKMNTTELTLSEFKNKVRPAYIKCIDTVAKQIESDAIDNTTFLKARYKEGSTPRAAVTEVLTSLKNAQRAKVNLLAGATSK